MKGWRIAINEKPNKLDNGDFLKSLVETINLEQFVKDHFEEMEIPAFCEYINNLCKDKSEVPEHIIKRGNIERSFGHQLFKGTKKPSRDTVLQLAFGFEAGLDLTQELLKCAGMSILYPRVKRDAVIIFCLYHHFTFIEAQNILHDLNLPLIGRRKQY